MSLSEVMLFRDLGIPEKVLTLILILGVILRLFSNTIKYGGFIKYIPINTKRKKLYSIYNDSTLSKDLHDISKKEIEMINRIKMTGVYDREVTNYLIDLLHKLDGRISPKFFKPLSMYLVLIDGILKVDRKWSLKFDNFMYGLFSGYCFFVVICIFIKLMTLSPENATALNIFILFIVMIVLLPFSIWFLSLIITKKRINAFDKIIKMYHETL